MIQKIEESQVPDYTPIRGGGMFFLFLLFATAFTVMLEREFYLLHAHSDPMQWLASSLTLPLVIYGLLYLLMEHPHQFVSQYFWRNVCGYILVICRNQNLSNSEFFVIPQARFTRSSAVAACSFPSSFIIFCRLGGWIDSAQLHWSPGDLLNNDQIIRLDDPLFQLNLDFRYRSAGKSSIDAPWLLEMRDKEGNRIVCDWQKPFVIMQEIHKSSKINHLSKNLLFDVLVDYFKQSVGCYAAKRRIAELETILDAVEKESADKDQKIVVLNGKLIHLLMDCINGISETKRFIHSKDARKLKIFLLQRWVNQVTDCDDEEYVPLIEWLQKEWEKEKSWQITQNEKALVAAKL